MGSKEKVIQRECVVCGKALKIVLKNKGAYSGGYYFGEMSLPIGKGKYKKVGKVKFGKMEGNVVKWIGKKKKFEYWECEKCFNADEFEEKFGPAIASEKSLGKLWNTKEEDKA